MKQAYRVLHLSTDFANTGKAAWELKKSKTEFEHLVVLDKEEFLNALGQFSPDIILCDHSLTPFNCKQALEIIKLKKIIIPYIRILPSCEVSCDLFEEGADEYIYTGDEEGLPTAIKNAIEKYLSKKERKQGAEQKLMTTADALHQALNDLKKIMGSSLDVICSIDEEGRFVNVSSASESIWGYKPSELSGRRYMDLVWEQDAEHTTNVAAAIMNGSPVTMFENHFMHKDGNIVPILWSARWDDNDKLMYCVAKDATEKKRLEKAFEAEQKRFTDVFLTAPSSIHVVRGPNHIFEMANPRYLNLTGKKDVVGKTMREVFPEAAEQGFLTLLDDVYATGKTFTANEMLLKIDREGNGKLSDVYLNLVYQPYKNSEGETEGIFCFANDVTEQVQARKKIEESEMRYRQLIQDLPGAIYTCDAEGTIILYNKAAAALWGREPSTGDRWGGSWKIFNPDGTPLPVERSPMALTLFEGRPVVGEEIVIEQPNGERRHVLPHPIPVFDNSGTLTGAVNMLMDITEHKLAEEKLKQNERMLYDAQHVAQFGSWELELVNMQQLWLNKLRLSEQLFKLFGLEKTSDFPFEDFVDLVHRDDRKVVTESFQKLLEENTPVSLENRIVRSDGKIRWVTQHAEIIVGKEKGKRLKIVGTVKDITQRKEAEEKLLETEAHLHTIFNNTETGYILINEDLDVVAFNQQASRSFLTFHGQVLSGGKAFLSYFPPTELEHACRSLQRASTGQDIEYEISRPSSTGDRWFMIKMHRILSEAGKVLGICISSTDITERKKTEIEREYLIEHLTNSNHDLKQFNFITSHNFRAPLSNLIGLLSLVDYSALDESTRDIFSMLKCSTEQLNQTVKDLIQILIIKQNVPPKISRICINEVFDKVSKYFVNEIVALPVTINTNFSCREVCFNRSYLESVLQNLLSNAIKYRSPERPLQIDITTTIGENGNILLSFSDNGVGIDMKRNKDRIFGLYQRFHSDPEGQGLGLFITKSQVTALGGRIEVESQVDKGTTFLLTLKDVVTASNNFKIQKN
jgi:PAS domain S-box-containing protein